MNAPFLLLKIMAIRNPGGRFRRVAPMSRKRRALRAEMAAAWASFAERSEPGYQPDALGDGDAHTQGDAEVSSVSMETGGEDAGTI